MSGHYVSVARHETPYGDWWYYNDEMRRAARPGEIQSSKQEKSYILFYEKVRSQQTGASAAPERETDSSIEIHDDGNATTAITQIAKDVSENTHTHRTSSSSSSTWTPHSLFSVAGQLAKTGNQQNQVSSEASTATIIHDGPMQVTDDAAHTLASRQERNPYYDAQTTTCYSPDSDVPALHEVPPNFHLNPEEALQSNELLPSPKISKAAHNVAKAQITIWARNLDRSEHSRHKLMQKVIKKRYQSSRNNRSSATPGSLSSTVSCSPPPTNIDGTIQAAQEQVATKSFIDVCQICESGVPWREHARCDGCHRNRGSCCSSKPPAPFNAYCVACERDSGNSREDAEGILALTKTCKAARCDTFTNIVLSVARSKQL